MSLGTDAVPLPAGDPLLRGLVADAAMFPPAALALGDALRAHRRHRESSYAPAVGPFLVAASGVTDLVRALDAEGAAQARGDADGLAPAHRDDLEAEGAALGLRDVLDVVLVARPGADPAALASARRALQDEPRVRVVAAELGWRSDWRELALDGLPLALEVPRGDEHDVALADIRTGLRDGLPVTVKFRTGPTPTWSWPAEDELADLLVRCAAMEVPFRLTGGLHHAARGTYEVDGVPEENHGLLNVLLATSAALAGAGPEEVTGVLAVRDAQALADLVGAWADATTHQVRAAFTGYGCCTVTDPLGELAALGLLSGRPDPRTPDP